MNRIGIIGVTGYVGGELARWVLAHPELELAVVSSRSAADRPLAAVHPGLAGLTDLTVRALDVDGLGNLDAVVLATPHGVAAELVPQLDHGGVRRILDLSRDHRHATGWVYGLPEWNALALDGATRVAAPGCFATAICLALAPLVAADAVRGSVQVAAITGSTGSGATPIAGTHHPARFANVRAYKVLEHQHVPEILGCLSGLGDAPAVNFVPQSGPFDRGIFATCFVPVSQDLDCAAVFADSYADAPLVRVRQGSPELRFVRGTGFCDLAVHQRDGLAVVLSAIDNLGRGAAAQGVRCLEQMLGIDPSPPLPSLIP